jgi:hypothetical protein
MIVCEFCLHYTQGGECRVGLNIPKAMSCRDFKPGMEKFCADPKDFVSENQIVQMATFFGFQRTELKKVKAMAAGEVKRALLKIDSPDEIRVAP